MSVLVAVDEPLAGRLCEGLRDAGVPVAAAVPADAASAALADGVDSLVLRATRRTLDRRLVTACDAAGVRIVPLCATADDERVAAVFGVGPVVAADADAWSVADALASPGPAPAGGEGRAGARAPGPRVIAVWGPAGAPGRSTLAVELAAELARGGRHVCLADADSHAPALALLLGLADEGPGFASACRQAARGGLDAPELDRISTPVPVAGGCVDVLPGINRPSRWPELAAPRVTAALTACRGWAEHTVVDVAASLEQDEEIVSDLADGPRRNAAAVATLRSADHVVAVLAADPLGTARFLRAHAELRAVVGETPVTVVANRLRPGTLGVDARGQLRRTLERFAGIRDVWFVPQDPRAVDAAVLAARPAGDVTPRAPLVQAVRRVAASLVDPPALRARPRRGRRTSRPASRP